MVAIKRLKNNVFAAWIKLININTGKLTGCYYENSSQSAV